MAGHSKANTLEDLALQIGVPAENLKRRWFNLMSMQLRKKTLSLEGIRLTWKLLI